MISGASQEEARTTTAWVGLMTGRSRAQYCSDGMLPTAGFDTVETGGFCQSTPDKALVQRDRNFKWRNTCRTRLSPDTSVIHSSQSSFLRLCCLAHSHSRLCCSNNVKPYGVTSYEASRRGDGSGRLLSAGTALCGFPYGANHLMHPSYCTSRWRQGFSALQVCLCHVWTEDT